MPVLLTRRESHPSKVSVKERIHMYSDHVKQKGGTPPAPEPTMFVQKGRRSTMPIIEPLPQKTHRPERGKSAPFPLRILPATLSDSHLLSAQPTRTGNPPRRQSFHCIEDDDDDIEAGIALSSLREWRKKQASFHVPTHETANGHECSQPQLTVTVGDDRGLSVSDIGIGFDNDNDSAEQVRDWVLTNGNGNSHPVRSNTHSRVRLCRSSDTTMYSGEAEEVNKLRGDNSFLLAENRQLKQRLLLLERSLPVEIDVRTYMLVVFRFCFLSALCVSTPDLYCCCLCLLFFTFAVVVYVCYCCLCLPLLFMFVVVRMCVDGTYLPYTYVHYCHCLFSGREIVQCVRMCVCR